MAYVGHTQWLEWYCEAVDVAKMTPIEGRQYADMMYAQERGRPFGDNAASGPTAKAPLALPAPAPSAQATAPVAPKLTTKPFPHARPRKTAHAPAP